MNPVISTADVNFDNLDNTALENMVRAASEIESCMDAARRANSNIVWDVLRHEKEIITLDHYPSDDVEDKESGSQYYYHCHREGEHGHFHCFLMEQGIPSAFSPVENQRLDLRDKDFTEAFCHLVAIGMDEFGQPQDIFTTNRWVTQEVVYPADEVVEMLDRFSIDHSFPAWTTNRWVTAMITLLKPQIVNLLHARDEAYRNLHALIDDDSDDVIYEYEDCEILSRCEIDLSGHISDVRNAATARNLTI